MAGKTSNRALENASIKEARAQTAVWIPCFQKQMKKLNKSKEKYFRNCICHFEHKLSKNRYSKGLDTTGVWPDDRASSQYRDSRLPWRGMNAGTEWTNHVRIRYPPSARPDKSKPSASIQCINSGQCSCYLTFHIIDGRLRHLVPNNPGKSADPICLMFTIYDTGVYLVACGTGERDIPFLGAGPGEEGCLVNVATFDRYNHS